MVDNHVQSAPQYQAPPQQYQQPPATAGFMGGMGGMGGGGAGGGMLQRFLGGGMGRAIVTGAGFGIGDDIINHIL
jgi:predicted lipid-binding transport protein (Tim44 family)